MIQTLEEAEKFFNIDNIPNIELLRKRHNQSNPIINRITVILNHIRVRKQLIKYDLIENGNDVLIYWENRPEINTW